jgi:hypothetical protein
MAEAPDPRPPVWTGHVILGSSDTIAAARFYEQIGMRPVQVAEHFSVLEMRGGTHLAIRHDPEHVAPGPASWDLMVDDLDVTHDKWQAQGLPVSPIKDGPPHRSGRQWSLAARAASVRWRLMRTRRSGSDGGRYTTQNASSPSVQACSTVTLRASVTVEVARCSGHARRATVDQASAPTTSRS